MRQSYVTIHSRKYSTEFYVFGLEVSVGDALGVEVGDSAYNFMHDPDKFSLRELKGFVVARQVASTTEFHHLMSGVKQVQAVIPSEVDVRLIRHSV